MKRQPLARFAEDRPYRVRLSVRGEGAAVGEKPDILVNAAGGCFADIHTGIII